MVTISLLVLIGVIFGKTQGALKTASYYSDHMVLQRGPQRAVIWGTSDTNGDTVTARISDHGSPVTTTVQQGVWKLKLPAITEPGPFTIDISSNDGHVTLRDVLFGDVWLCSGQSNMEFEMKKVWNSSAEVQKALEFQTIRYLESQYTQSRTPMTDLTISIPWTSPSTASLNEFSAICFLFAEYIQPHLKYPIGLIGSYWGGTTIEPWSPPEAIKQCPAVTHPNEQSCCPYTPEVLWNAKIYPLLPFTIKGALWYQGEANWDHTVEYACQVKAMVEQWRVQFNKGSLGETPTNFPFGYVQLCGYRESDLDSVASFPAVRWSQTVSHGYSPNSDLPNTFMAVSMDLPDFTSPYDPIHSRRKQEVAKRLVLGALNVAYGQHNVAFQGPFPTKFTPEGSNRLTIEYDSGRAHLQIKNNNGFEICCSERQPACDMFSTLPAAPITGHTESTVTIDTSRCGAHQVVGLRYAWRSSPCRFEQCAIYDSVTGLPAPPYYLDSSAQGSIIG